MRDAQLAVVRCRGLAPTPPRGHRRDAGGDIEAGYRRGDPAISWPLNDIVITNIVWCMAHTRGVGWGSYIAH